MSDSSKRDEWDQHNRDEARERAAQQEAAGPAHRPVPTEPYASLGGSPAAGDAQLDVTDLIGDYERSAAAERLAWDGVREAGPDPIGSEAWNAWRDAVERTQEAARSLVNHGTARSDRSRGGESDAIP